MFILENDKMLEVEGKEQSFKSPFCIYYRKEPGNEVSNEALSVLICHPDLIKVSNDLIQESQAFQAFLVDITLGVKLFEIRNWCEHHTDAVIGLVVKVL